MRATKDLNKRVAQRSRRPALASRLLVAAVAAHHSTGAFGFHAVPPFAAGGPLARAGVGPGVSGPALRALAPRTPPALARAARRQCGAQAPRMLVTGALPVELPVLAFKAVMATAHAYPLVVDSLFAGLLYVLGKATSSAILGQRESGASLQKWFICGLADGLACHAWYSLMEAKCGFIANNVHRALAMNGVSSVFFTPTYCVGFLILLSLLEGKGARGAADRLQRDGGDLVAKSVQVWGMLNMPLFLLVPLHLRVMVSMGFHYIYLVGLALWDANTRKAADAGSLSEAPLVPAVEMTSSLHFPTAIRYSHGKRIVGEDIMVRETAWGSDFGEEGTPALNLAVAKVPLVDLDTPHGPHSESPGSYS